jgi:hypothetical protein
MINMSTATPEAPAVNDMVAVVASKIAEQTEQANALVGKLNSATTDTKALVHQIRDDADNAVGSNNEVVKAWREWSEVAMAEYEAKRAQVDEYIAANLLPKADESFDAEAAKAQYQELKKTIAAGKTFLTKMFGENALDGTNVPDLKSLRGGTSSSTGAKRPRLANVWLGDAQGETFRRIFDKVEQKYGTTNEVQTFSLLASVLSSKDEANVKVEPKDLQAAAFAEAGTDDLSTKAGEIIEFAYSPDGGKHTYTVRVQPVDKDAAEVAKDEVAK